MIGMKGQPRRLHNKTQVRKIKDQGDEVSSSIWSEWDIVSICSGDHKRLYESCNSCSILVIDWCLTYSQWYSLFCEKLSNKIIVDSNNAYNLWDNFLCTYMLWDI